MRRSLISIVALCIIASLIVGCGNKENFENTVQVNEENNDVQTNSTSSSDIGNEDTAEVTWMMWNVGGTFTQNGLQAVEDAVNDITLEKINVHVNIEMLEMGSYLSQMPMQVGAGDKIDLISTFPAAAGTFNSMVNSGQLLPLNELLEEFASETLELLPEDLLEATTIDGNIYAVPIYADKTNDLHWICRESYLTEAGFSAEDIHSYEDITKVFEAVHELHPDMKMISSGAKELIGSAGVFFTGVTYDTLGTNLAAVMIENDSTKVVSLYETEEFQEVYAVLRDWYEKGYVDQDIIIREEDPTADSTIFSFFLAGSQSRTAGNQAMAGEPLVSVELTEGCVSTESMTRTTMAIPVCATEPEAAAKLMNLCYTDKELKMLVSYGLEGINYSYNEAGGIVVNTASNYVPNTSGIFGNVFLCDPIDTDLAIGYNMADIDQNELMYSPLLGFSVDTDEISTEVAALSSVYTEYQGLINCGLADDKTFQEFIDKLYSNGFDKYLAEIQRQLDEWAE